MDDAEKLSKRSKVLTRSQRAGRIITTVLLTLLPSFFHRHPQGTSKPAPQFIPNQTIAYLLGLRGVAALTVAIFHWSHNWYPAMSHAWGDDVPAPTSPSTTSQPPPQYSSILQLPIIRLFYAAEASVAIFFIISGYVLALGPLRRLHGANTTTATITVHRPAGQQQQQQVVAFINSLSSLALRRFFRLYIPALATTGIAFVADLFGVLGMQKEEQAPAARLWEKTLRLAAYLRALVNVWEWEIRWPGEAWWMSPYLWTVPVEWRCSLALFGVMVMLFRVKRRNFRRSVVGGIAAWALVEGHWDFCLFVAGYGLAERRVVRECKNKGAEGVAADLPHSTAAVAAQKTSPLARHLRPSARYVLLTTGLVLLSYPPHPPSSIAVPIYGPLASIVEFKPEGRRLWHTLGSITVLIVLEQTVMRRLFETSLARYLGRISYPLYLIHGPLIWIVGWRIRAAVVRGTPENWGLNVKFGIATAAFFPVLVWAADLFERAVERRAIAAARWVEQLLVLEGE